MNRFSECIVEVGFPAEDERKAVDGIIVIVHEHFEVIKDGRVQILSFINRKNERLAFLLIKVKDLFFDSFKHTGFSAFWRKAENVAQLPVEFRDAYG